jgi:hypothetical protein
VARCATSSRVIWGLLEDMVSILVTE